ncbi:MAG TPA: hypothetical protein DEB73_01370 [Candidatus Magasanikbacteria bacterium]|nr:hypothetical protein [Candidatus Magasanikbacteria bacterium]HBX15951.1 hypothetical protein [Candidatus Magasanikbacteria bacterium]
MRVYIQAKPNAREEKIEKIDETHFTVAVREPPVNGLANVAIRKALAAHFKVAPSCVRLASGFSSRNKVFEILL